jgi:hypothetical protein
MAALLAAAFGHPDQARRLRVRRQLDKWLCEAIPRHDKHTISQALLSHPGTALEPFFLSEERLDMAVFAVQASFSKVVNDLSLRIVSEETFGCKGGLVLSPSLDGCYYERFAFAKPSRRVSEAQNGHYLAPGELLRRPAATWSSRASEVEAQFSITTTGFTIEITWSNTPRPSGILKGGLAGHTKALHEWGLWTREEHDRILVGTTNTDAFLRLSAHIMDNPVLRLGFSSNTALFIQLRLPEENHMKLPVAVLWDEPLAHSCSLNFNTPIPTTVEDRLAIAQVFQPPSDWLTSEFMEAWSETL